VEPHAYRIVGAFEGSAGEARPETGRAGELRSREVRGNEVGRVSNLLEAGRRATKLRQSLEGGWGGGEQGQESPIHSRSKGGAGQIASSARCAGKLRPCASWRAAR
jgi:hypothetical protein